MEVTIALKGVKATVHTETGRHAALKRQLYAKIYDPTLGDNDPEWSLWYDFLNAYIQSTDVVVPFEWLPMTLDVEALRPVRDNWLALSGKVWRAWVDAVNDVEPKGDEDLLPIAKIDPKD